MKEIEFEITVLFAEVDSLNSNKRMLPWLPKPQANSDSAQIVLMTQRALGLFFNSFCRQLTFLTADSNMLQKIGNCLKLPVLRVRSSTSVEERFLGETIFSCILSDI